MTVTVTGSWSFLPDATAVIQGYHGHGHGPWRDRDYDEIPVTVTWPWPKKSGHAGLYCWPCYVCFNLL
jgi:hypothetical protein